MIQNSIIQAVSNARNWAINEPFLSFESADGLWTVIDEGDSTQTINDGGGLKLLATTANEESGFNSTNKLFDFAANTTGADYDEGGVSFAIRNDRDGTGTTSGWFVGISDDIADMITDTTGLIATSFSGLGFVLEKSTTVLKIVYAVAGTPTTVALSAGVAGVSAEAVTVAAAAISNAAGTMGQVLSIQFKQTGSTTADVKWFVNNTLVYSLEGLDVTSFAAAYIEATIKATGSSDEILYVDAVSAYCHRGAKTLVLA